MIAIAVNGEPIRDVESTALLGGDLEVLIIAVQIMAGRRVTYRVVWTLDGKRQDEWVEEVELEDKP